MTHTYTPQQIQVYNAVNAAALRINEAQYAAEMKLTGKRPKVFTPSQEVNELIEALPKILSGEMTPEQGMALLHYGETGNTLRKVLKGQ